MITDLRAETDFLVLAVVRMAFVLPLLLLVLEFAEVHDSANGRLLRRRDLDQIETCGPGLLQRFVGTDDSQLRSVVTNDADR